MKGLVDLRVKVMNREDAVRYSYRPQNEDSVVISIGDVESVYRDSIFPSIYNRIFSVLPLKFDDVDGGKNCITKEDAQMIKSFVGRHKDKLIIVHCDGGISRSAGIAAALLKFYNGDDSEIFDNGRYRPNMLCYRTMLNVLEEE